MEKYLHVRAINERFESIQKKIVLKSDNPFFSKGYTRVLEILLSNISPGQTIRLVFPALMNAADDVEYIVNIVVFMELELLSRISILFNKTARHELSTKTKALMSIPSDSTNPEEDNIEKKCKKLRTWSLEDQKRFFSTRMREYVRISSEITLALLDE